MDHILKHSKSGFVTDTELIQLVGGTPAQRYGKVKRAIAEGSLLHLRRGVYAVSTDYLRKPYHLLEAAAHIYAPSYISFESALSYHGWIPESVPIVTSATPRRKSVFDSVLGRFLYLHVPESHAFSLVARVQNEDGGVFFMASPWKAIADYVYVFQKKWSGIDPLVHSLRLDIDQLVRPTNEEVAAISLQYPYRRMGLFMEGVQQLL